MKKLVGIVPLFDDKLQNTWMLMNYPEALLRCGAVPITLPFSEDEETLRRALSVCDGLLVPGGQDWDPTRFGEAPLPQCGTICLLRDRMEDLLLPMAAELDLPTLGICRGVQSLNVAFGGTLYQDLSTQHPSLVPHRFEPLNDCPAHSVTLYSPLREIFGAETISVNSHHHQAVKDVAPFLRAAAEAEDGVIEAVCLPGKRFFLGVQWHPELMAPRDSRSLALFRAFTDAM